MKPLPPATVSDRPRVQLWKPIATPVVATLAIGAVALAAITFVTVFLLIAGFALAGFLLWRVSGLLPRWRREADPDITAPRANTVNFHSNAHDRDEFDAFLNARARPRD